MTVAAGASLGAAWAAFDESAALAESEIPVIRLTESTTAKGVAALAVSFGVATGAAWVTGAAGAGVACATRIPAASAENADSELAMSVLEATVSAAKMPAKQRARKGTVVDLSKAYPGKIASNVHEFKSEKQPIGADSAGF